MALAKLDDGGNAKPPKPTPGSSSPPPNTGSSSKNQPSNGNNGKKPESGKNKNKEQPQPKKPATTQPVATPKGETLEQAITRMRNQDFPEWQINAQIKKWHPTWTDAQIAKTMKAAPGPGGYIDQARANAAKGKASGHGGGIKELKQAIGAVGHAATAAAKSNAVHAVVKHTDRALHRDVKYAKVLGKEAEKHPELIAAAATAALLIPGVDLVELGLLADAAGSYAFYKDVSEHHYTAAVLDIGGIGFTRLAEFDKALKGVREMEALRDTRRAAPIVREIADTPKPTPESVQRELTHVINLRRAGRLSATDQKRLAAFDRAMAALSTSLGAAQPKSHEKR